MLHGGSADWRGAMNSRLTNAGIASALLACACAAATGPQSVELQTDRSAYVIGDQGSLILKNHGPHATTRLLPCSTTPVVEQQFGDRWQRVSPDYDAECGYTPETSLVEPGNEVAAPFSVTPEFFPAPGVYRIRGSVAVAGASEAMQLVSNTLTVSN